MEINDRERLLDESNEDMENELSRELDELGKDEKKEIERTEEPDRETEERRKKRTQRIKKNGYLLNWIDDKNPYREQSSIDLDNEKEDGWRWIETSVLLKLFRSRLTGTEWSIFFYILDRTRGWSNKKTKFHPEERLKICDIVRDTGIPRRSVYRGLESLENKRLIYKVVNKNGNVKWGNNFRFDTWVC